MSAYPLTYMFQEDLYSFTQPVVVVLAKPWLSYSAEEQKLLQKILTSVKVDMDAVHMAVYPWIKSDSLPGNPPARVLIFGAEAGDEFPLYQEAAVNGFTLIRADDLSDLNEEKKKDLWAALRKMFGM